MIEMKLQWGKTEENLEAHGVSHHLWLSIQGFGSHRIELAVRSEVGSDKYTWYVAVNMNGQLMHLARCTPGEELDSSEEAKAACEEWYFMHSPGLVQLILPFSMIAADPDHTH